MKIAEALLLRKQLQDKVEQLKPLKTGGEKGLFELQTKRMNVSDSTDEVTFQIPRITLADVTKTYDHYASELRKIDAAIQKANWQFDVDYKEAKIKEEKSEAKAA